MQNPVDGTRQADRALREKPLFAARLTPYRSLGRRGFLILMILFGLSCFVSGMVFLTIGAWPVFGFFGLDVLLLYIAFKVNYRSARAFEEIAIWREAIEFRQVAPSGRATVHRFNPFWLRFIVERHEEFGITRMALREKDREVDIGGFLNPADRDSFATAFARALSRARG